MPSPTSTATAKRTLTLGHSPDPDDAFMFYAMATDRIDMRGWQFEHILQDIQTLNERARREELDISAVSIHAYAYISDKYALLDSGSSMGDNYGPMIVAPRMLTHDELRATTIAVPGTMTTAFLTLQLALGRDLKYEVVPFDEILAKVENGAYQAGLIIHEGQLTYQNNGLVKVIDLGEWWMETRGLPLPLGGNVVRRSLGDEAIAEISEVLRESIVYSLEHRHEAVAHALAYARDMGHELADKFVGMYVNDYTVSYGEKGRAAVARLLEEAAAAGIIPAKPDLKFV